jgi:hypothetical protein
LRIEWLLLVEQVQGLVEPLVATLLGVVELHFPPFGGDFVRASGNFKQGPEPLQLVVVLVVHPLPLVLVVELASFYVLDDDICHCVVVSVRLKSFLFSKEMTKQG